MIECMSETQLIFEQHVNVHKDELYRIGVRLTGNAADARFLVQETFVKAMTFCDKYEPGTNLNAWLCRILKNSFINMYRRKLSETESFVILDRQSRHNFSNSSTYLQDKEQQ
jgi:RNA polymerase sigma-70 factor, ECF subfamily